MRALPALLLSLYSMPVWAQAEEPPPVYETLHPTIRPPHQGFTCQLSLGVGAMVVGSAGGNTQSSSALGLGGLNALAGGFLTDDLVLALKVDLANSSLASTAVFGPTVQWWISEELTLGAGVGVGTGDKLDGSNLAFLLYAAWNLYHPAPHHAFGAYLDVDPVLSDPKLFIVQVGAAWQFY